MTVIHDGPVDHAPHAFLVVVHTDGQRTEIQLPDADDAPGVTQ